MKRYLVSLAVFLVSMYSYSQILDWGNRLGGDYSDICCDIETDKHENIYITGGICNTVNFDLKGGSYILSANEVNQSEIFVALYNSERDLIKAFVLNGSAWDYATDLEIDSLRNIYISGFYSGTIDFDPGQDEYNMSSSKSMCFVAKYDSSGNFKWSKNISIMKETYRLIYSPLLFVDGNSNIYLSTPDTLCKIETDGNILWSVATNGSAVFDGRSSFYVSSIAYLSYYPVAQTDDTIFISKIDTSGFEVFTKEIILFFMCIALLNH